MARPRKDDAQAAATAKIETAFWRLLGEVGYSELTVRRISQESGTNRNSFYYHYDGIEDLARSSFKNNADEAAGLVASLLDAFHNGRNVAVPPSPSALSHAGRVMLCARSESPFLRHMVSDLLRDTWFEALGINAERLSPTERMEVEFIFSGLVSVLGSREVEQSPLAMTSLANSAMGKAAIGVLEEIASAQAKDAEASSLLLR